MLVNDGDISSDAAITKNPASSKQPAAAVSPPLCCDGEAGDGGKVWVLRLQTRDQCFAGPGLTFTFPSK